MDIHSLLDRMEAAEEAFLQTEFLAPVLPGSQVRVRIAGLICTMLVTGRPDPGWAILKPLSLDRARVVDRPSLTQVREYLSLFPDVRLVLVARVDGIWLALPAHRGDTRLQITGPVPVHMVSGAEPFQQIIARFDGVLFWFQEVDRRRSPAIAAYLRDALAAETSPDDLHKPTLTAEERESYAVAYKAIEAAQRDRVLERLSDALAHAGAGLASYIERADAYTVSFTVDGEAYRSTVRKDDLSVLVAGVCLGGRDRSFDLQSLVGVLREGQHRRFVRLVRVGEGERLGEGEYWQIHPPPPD